MRRSLRWLTSHYGVDDRLLSLEVKAGRLPAERVGRALAVDETDFRAWARLWIERLRQQLEAPR